MTVLSPRATVSALTKPVCVPPWLQLPAGLYTPGYEDKKKHV